jgi:hypothetical protein
MKTRRIFATPVVLLLLATCLFAQSQSKVSEPKITVTGMLSRVMAIGGESSGWSVKFDSHTAVEGRYVDSLEVKFADPKQAESFENKRVKVTGTLMHVHGVETGDRVVMEVTSIKTAKPSKKTT